MRPVCDRSYFSACAGMLIRIPQRAKTWIRSRFGRSHVTGQIVAVTDSELTAWVSREGSAESVTLFCAIDGVRASAVNLSAQQLLSGGDRVEIAIHLESFIPEAHQLTLRIGRFGPHLAGSPWFLHRSGPQIKNALLHIPKTAGTSLRVALEASLGPHAVFPSAEYLRRRGGKYLNGNEIELALTGASPDVKLVQGHFSAKEIYRLAPDANVITVLRKPVDRVISLLRHMQARHGVHASFEDMIKPGGAAAGPARNQQTRLLSLLDPQAPIDEHLDSAKEQLARFAVVGLTERYPETLALCESLLGVALGAPMRLNTGSGTDIATPSVLLYLEDLNQVDAALYTHAEQQFELQLAGGRES